MVPYILVAPAVVVLCVLFVYPIARLVQLSMLDNSLVASSTRFVGSQNFVALKSDPVFWSSFGNTLMFTASSVLLHLALGLALALLLHQRLRPSIRSVFRGILIVPWMFTAAVVAIDWRLILSPFGVLNGTLALMRVTPAARPVDWMGEPALAMPALVVINLWRGYPLVMLLLLAGLQNIPPELHEAGAVDGANLWGQFRYITLPSLKPVIASVALLDAIWNFRLFDLVFLTTGGGPMNQTQVLSTYDYRLAFESFRFGTASALSVMMLLFTLLLSLAYFRYQQS